MAKLMTEAHIRHLRRHRPAARPEDGDDASGAVAAMTHFAV
jgi:hypothetical protein